MKKRFMSILSGILMFCTVNISGETLKNEPTWISIRFPERYENLVPRIYLRSKIIPNNLILEGNNIDMRETLSESSKFPVDGEKIMFRWRKLVSMCKGVFVLRDSLFSQQDHPIKIMPQALMIPPSWVLAAVAIHPLKPVKSYPEEDDANWTVIPSSTDLFGSFPPSDELYHFATRSLSKAFAIDALFIRNARNTIRYLAKQTAELEVAAQKGQQEVISVGAEFISASDRKYFGESLRRTSVIPIFVENPSIKEVQEGKGMLIPDHPEISEELSNRVRNAIYRRRLQDGDIAVERYDLSNPFDRRRAIELLEALIPAKESSGKTVWLWVTGKLKVEKKLSGENALPYIEEFRKELRTTSINQARLKYFSKPSVSLSTGARQKKSLEDAVELYEKMNLPLSLNIDTKKLQSLIEK